MFAATMGHIPSLRAWRCLPLHCKKSLLGYAQVSSYYARQGAGGPLEDLGGDLHDGKLWGRGASDTKGPMAAMLWALHTLRDQIPHLPVEVHFVGFMSEESHQYGSKHFSAHHPRYDLALVGEPTEMRVVHTHKGCLWIDVHTQHLPPSRAERPTHATRPGEELEESHLT